MAGFIWVQGEIACLTKIVNSTEDNTLESKWAPIARAMIIEQPKHLRGGELFEQDPWPQRVYTPQKVSAKWRSMQRDARIEARVQEIAALKALEETKAAEEAARMLEDDMAREVEQELEKALKSLQGMEFQEFSEHIVKEVEEELERLRALCEAKARGEAAQ